MHGAMLILKPNRNTNLNPPYATNPKCYSRPTV